MIKLKLCQLLRPAEPPTLLVSYLREAPPVSRSGSPVGLRCQTEAGGLPHSGSIGRVPRPGPFGGVLRGLAVLLANRG